MTRRIATLALALTLAACGGPSAANETTPAPSSDRSKRVHDKQGGSSAPTPITPGSADDIHEALTAASNDEAALRNLIDPRWGVGSYDRGDLGIEHHCDRDEMTTHPGMGFVVRADEPFACDRRLRRCTAQDPAGGGYVFHFRDGPGDAIWLNAVIHHERNVPRRSDSRAVRNFVEGGDGVCALWRVVEDENHEPPRRLSVFVAHETGLVPEVVSDHLCGDEAVAAFRQRLVGYLSANPDIQCRRSPSRCGFTAGDEEVTMYGGEEGMIGIAITRPGMHAHLARAQQRDVDAWLRGMNGHSCEE